MRLFLSGHGVGGDLVRRRAREHSARLLLQTAQLVELSVPFIVGHQFAPSVVISVGSLVELTDELLHQIYVAHGLVPVCDAKLRILFQ